MDKHDGSNGCVDCYYHFQYVSICFVVMVVDMAVAIVVVVMVIMNFVEWRQKH